MNSEHLPEGKPSQSHSGSQHTAQALPSTPATLPNPTDQDEKKPKPLNPRAPPFLYGNPTHPPIPISSDSNQSSDATITQAAPLTAWHWTAPLVSIPAPVGASTPAFRHIPGHNAYMPYPAYPFQEPPPPPLDQTRHHTHDNNLTQIAYSENNQNGVSQVGFQGVNYPASYHVPMCIPRPAYYIDKGALWSTAIYGSGWEKMVRAQQEQYQQEWQQQQLQFQQQLHFQQQQQYQQQQQFPVYAATFQDAAGHFAGNRGRQGGRRGKKNGGWSKKKKN